jgi:hypothetical protein
VDEFIDETIDGLGSAIDKIGNVCFFNDSQEKLDNHMRCCDENEMTQLVMPKEGSVVKFANQQNEFKHPFAVFANFESTLVQMEDENKSCTQKVQKHVPNFCFGLKFNCIYPEYSEEYYQASPSQFTNEEDLIRDFVTQVEDYARHSYIVINQNKTNQIVSLDQKHKHYSSTECDHCGIGFDEKHKKCLHHDHIITGQYISTLCGQCNTKFQYKRFLPVYMHNLTGYDSHLFVKMLGKFGDQSDDNNISAIPNNQEKYISFSKKIKVGSYQIQHLPTPTWDTQYAEYPLNRSML